MSFSENLINIFDAIGKQLGIVVDWSNQNIMPYIEQLAQRIVNYEMITSIAWLVFFVILLIVGIFLIKTGIKDYKREDRYCYEEKYIIFFAIGTILIGVSVLKSLAEIGDVITCLTLPEKTLIEFISEYK